MGPLLLKTLLEKVDNFGLFRGKKINIEKENLYLTYYYCHKDSNILRISPKFNWCVKVESMEESQQEKQKKGCLHYHCPL